MIQNIPTNVINYIDSKGKLITNQIINNIQIRTEDDLSLLTERCVGTRAYLPDESKTWVYGADAQWHEVTNESSGSGNGVLLVHQVYDEDSGSTSLDKTWKEIYNAFTTSGAVVEMTNTNTQTISTRNIICVSEADESYKVDVLLYADSIDTYTTQEENGYPHLIE